MGERHVRIEISDSVLRTFVLAEDSITRLSDEMMIAAKFSEISPAARAQVFPFFSACILRLICYNSIKNARSF